MERSIMISNEDYMDMRHIDKTMDTWEEMYTSVTRREVHVHF